MPEKIKSPEQLVDLDKGKMNFDLEIRNAVLGFEELIHDEIADFDTPFKELIKIVRRKISEQRRVIASARDTLEDKTRASLDIKDTVQKVFKTAEKLLVYFEAAEHRLVIILNVIEPKQLDEITLKDIRDKLNKKLDEIESATEQAEIESRNRVK